MMVHGAVWMLGGLSLFGVAVYLGASTVILAVAGAAGVVGLLDVVRGASRR